MSISTDVTLASGPNDVWIFQISGNISQAAAARVTLTGGALARNIFWQPAGAVTIGPTAHFEDIILSKTLIALQTGASANGCLLAQTAVTLDQNAVTQPAPQGRYVRNLQTRVGSVSRRFFATFLFKNL